MGDQRAERELEFREARAGVLGRQPRLREGVSVVLVECDETFALQQAGGHDRVPVGAIAAQFLRLVDGQRTVGEIIDAIAGEMAVTDAILAGKAAMAALHEFFLDGTISELRER